jgi:hypothetical protein
MNSKILKLSILAIFFSFAISAFFLSGDPAGAQNKQSAILEKVRSYKNWKQAVKPPVVTPEKNFAVVVVDGDPVKIDSSAGFG